MANTKQQVKQFWNSAACGEAAYAIGPTETERLNAQAAARFELEPYLKPFARFDDARGKDVLEVGVGMGADHACWALAKPKSLTGVDLTERAVQFTQARLAAQNLSSNVLVADAENLPFANAQFDIVYSWGVLHHSPNTAQAFAQVARVLRPGGVARIMVYHTWSLTGLMLWARYALLRGKPFTSMASIYSRFLESPGTKAYSKRQAAQLCRQAGFSRWSIRIQLNHGDLLQGHVGQRHQGRGLQLAKKIWPRWFWQNITPFLGLYVLIEAQK